MKRRLIFSPRQRSTCTVERHPSMRWSSMRRRISHRRGGMRSNICATAEVQSGHSSIGRRACAAIRLDPPLDGAFRFSLDVNCRNTRRIVVCANTATQIDERAIRTRPAWSAPKADRTQIPLTAISGLVQQEVRTLLKEHRLEPRQIAIIGPASKAKSPLASVTSVDGVALVDDASLWREGKGVLCSTARSFKGLEADVVILCDFSGLGSLFTVSDLYVALTRARSHLIIIVHDRAARESLDAALAAAIATGAEE